MNLEGNLKANRLCGLQVEHEIKLDWLQNRQGGRLLAFEGTHALQQTAPLFENLVGQGEQLIRHGEPERIGGLEVDDQIELGGSHDG